MPEQQHIIGRQRFELTIADRNQAMHWQDLVAQGFKHDVLPLLDRLFSELSTVDEVVRIDQLELDLGLISSTDFRTDLKRKLIGELEEELRSRIYRAKSSLDLNFSDGSVETRVFRPDEDLTDRLVTFLQTGILTWQAHDQVMTPRQLLEKVLEIKPAKARQVLPSLFQIEGVRKRLLMQYPRDLVERLMDWLFPFYRSEKHELQMAIKALLDADGLSHDSELAAPADERVWQQLWMESQLLVGLGGAKEGSAVWRQQWEHFVKLMMAANSIMTRRVLEFIHASIPSLRRSLPRKATQPLQAVLEEQASVVGIRLKPFFGAGKERSVKEHRQSPTELDSTPDQHEPGRDSFSRHKTEVQDGEPSIQDDPLLVPKASPPEVSEGARGEDIGREASENVTPTTSDDQAEEQRQGPSMASKPSSPILPPGKDLFHRVERPSTLPELDLLPVQNAGLVILHPFLKYFFQGLGLSQQDQFVSEEAQWKAVHLLQYPISLGTEVPEHELLLNKLLCGLPIEAPVPLTVSLTEEEREECENLLKVVLGRWTALKTEDSQALIETFLRREGTLTYGNGWTLKVSRDTFDILLDKLPWGISLIKLPWNPEMIYVEW